MPEKDIIRELEVAKNIVSSFETKNFKFDGLLIFEMDKILLLLDDIRGIAGYKYDELQECIKEGFEQLRAK